MRGDVFPPGMPNACCVRGRFFFRDIVCIKVCVDIISPAPWQKDMNMKDSRDSHCGYIVDHGPCGLWVVLSVSGESMASGFRTTLKLW